MPYAGINFTEAEKHRAAETIFKLRHPTFTYVPGSDQWAYQYACAALSAVVLPASPREGQES
jgi:hypothetical protein